MVQTLDQIADEKKLIIAVGYMLRSSPAVTKAKQLMQEVRCKPHCYAVLCCAVLCCAVLCCAVLCCAVLCCAVLCCAVLCRAVLCRAVPCRAVPCRANEASAWSCMRSETLLLKTARRGTFLLPNQYANTHHLLASKDHVQYTHTGSDVGHAVTEAYKEHKRKKSVCNHRPITSESRLRCKHMVNADRGPSNIHSGKVLLPLQQHNQHALVEHTKEWWLHSGAGYSLCGPHQASVRRRHCA